MSRETVDELLRVLAYPRFGLTVDELHYLLYVEVLPHAEMTRVRPGPPVISEDPSDDMFLRCALTGRAGFIISGDRHLLNLKTHHRIKILSPAAFLSRVKA